MKIKRYVVKEMYEAIKLIKQDLGPEAVIVSSYRVPPKGFIGLFMPKLLEVTAALDEPQDAERRVKRIPLRLAAAGGNRISKLIKPLEKVVLFKPKTEEENKTAADSQNLLEILESVEPAAESGLAETPEQTTNAGMDFQAILSGLTGRKSSKNNYQAVDSQTGVVDEADQSDVDPGYQLGLEEQETIESGFVDDAVTDEIPGLDDAVTGEITGLDGAVTDENTGFNGAAEKPEQSAAETGFYLGLEEETVESGFADGAATNEITDISGVVDQLEQSAAAPGFHPGPEEEEFLKSGLTDAGAPGGITDVSGAGRLPDGDVTPVLRSIITPAPGKSLFGLMVKHEMDIADNLDQWRQSLLDLDVDDKIVAMLMSDLQDGHGVDLNNPDSVYMSIRKKVIELLEPAYRTMGDGTPALQGSANRAKIMTFVGPTGVGKTTTLTKIATLMNLNEGKTMALITVQSYRLGAADQLREYGDILGVPTEVAMTPEELSRAMEKHSDKDFILIDTAGRSARNSGLLLELKSFINAVRAPQDVYLVMSVTTKNRDLHKTVREYLRVGCTKLIFTKLDETDTFGSILNMVVAHNIPAAYLTDGQVIPDCLSEAGPRSIAELLLRGINR